MRAINVFLTSDLGDRFDAFEHDELSVTFASMDSNGPRHVIDGTMMAFVDWVLPDISGLEMCRRLRTNPATADAHITIVLERDDSEDRRRALAAGADNYVVGPIDRTSILDRILSVYAQNANRYNTSQLVLGDLVLDTGSYLARWKGKPIDLRSNQFRLMRFFAERPNQLVTRKDVIEGLGKTDQVTDERTVDVWVKRLRRSLTDAGVGNPLRTVHGQGYVLDLP
ncbi:MAG: response regulator transcription factor [Novosphingobium sp.]|nr:response regulator transcription factor [Novosphingobium sp.]